LPTRAGLEAVAIERRRTVAGAAAVRDPDAGARDEERFDRVDDT
jgi:hypothetical protein